MRASFFVLLLAVILLFSSGWLPELGFWGGLEKIKQAEIGALEKHAGEMLAPPPLRSEKESQSSVLTRSGVIIWTNRERRNAELEALAENQKLNSAAETKVRDMFAKQYFEHVSPDGVAAADLARDAGYEYIAIGENLALGSFADDKELVEAWMASPGHRANILKPSYREIGVAVGRGEFEGKATWLAVQIFGRPRSDCPVGDESLKIRIDVNRARLDQLKSDIERLGNEIESTRPKRGSEYNKKVDAYNALVDTYNVLAAETKAAVETFNIQVQLFNQCVAR